MLAGPEMLQSSRRGKSLAKARPKKRAASEPEASASEEESLLTERSIAERSSKGPWLAEFKYAGSRSSDSPSTLRIATPPAAESSAVPAAESISEERAETPSLPHAPSPRFPDLASQPAPSIAASASEAYDEDDDTVLMPHPDVSASSLRAVTPVVADQQSSRVIVQVPVPKTPDPCASKTSTFSERPIFLMQCAVVVSQPAVIVVSQWIVVSQSARASTCRYYAACSRNTCAASLNFILFSDSVYLYLQYVVHSMRFVINHRSCSYSREFRCFYRCIIVSPISLHFRQRLRDSLYVCIQY